MEIMHIPLSQLSIDKANVRYGVKKLRFAHLMLIGINYCESSNFVKVGVAANCILDEIWKV